MRDRADNGHSYETGEQEIKKHLSYPERFALVDFVEEIRRAAYPGERSIRKHFRSLFQDFPFWHRVKN